MGEKSLTYRQLYDWAGSFASHLQSEGLHHARVALHLSNSLELVVAYLGCFMAGVVVVPMSVGLKKPEREYIYHRTRPERIIDTHTDLEILFHSDPLPLETPNPEEAAAIFFTSGSTGMPKGVVHSHRSLLATFDNMADAVEISCEDRFLVSEEMTNVSGCSHVFLSLYVGASVVILPEFSVEGFLQVLSHEPTMMCLMGKANFDVVNDPRLNPSHFANFKCNMTGGDKITQDLMQQFRQKTGIPMRLGYGMSECLVITIIKSQDEEKLGSVGREAKGVEIKLVGEEAWVKGPNCMMGYWEDPEATQAVFEDGWLRTGDLVRRDQEGFYWFIGRLKQIIIRGGDNISPFEVEEALSRHPAVVAVGVIGVPHPEEGEVPVAFVEIKKGQEVTESELLKFAESQLEDYKVPVAIQIIERLPRTMSGKIARNELSRRI